MQGMRQTDIANHRNGVGGVCFYAITFTYPEDRQILRMVAAVFCDPDHAHGEVEPISGKLAVLNAVDAVTGNVTRSYRGDNFEPVLRQWIAQYERKVQAAQDNPKGVMVDQSERDRRKLAKLTRGV